VYRESMSHLLLLSLLLGQAGCNTSSANGTAGSSVCNANPPSNIDIKLCSGITDGTDANKVTECSACCTEVGFPLSSFINDDRCTCGSTDVDAGQTACADKTSDSDGCLSCCTAAGFQNYQFAGDASCECSLRGNISVCQDALTDSDPAAACSCCCLNNGYISNVYIGVGTPQCECIGE